MAPLILRPDIMTMELKGMQISCIVLYCIVLYFILVPQNPAHVGKKLLHIEPVMLQQLC